MSFLSFQKWETSEKLFDLDVLITGGLLLVGMFLLLGLVAFGGDFQNVITNYTNLIFIILMLIVALGFQGIERGKSSSSKTVSFGRGSNAAIGIIVGSILGILIATIPAGKASVPNVPIDISFLISGYVFLAIPFAEEKLFRCTLPFILMPVIKNSVVVLLLASGIFSMYHLWVWQGGVGVFIFTFLLSVVALIGNEKLKTSLFGIGMHQLNNLVVTLSYLS